MRLVEKSSTVSELVPQGYKSWTHYYQKPKRECGPIIALGVLLLLYALVGALECAV